MNFREGNKEVPVGSLLHSPVTPWATNETEPLEALPHSGQWSLVPEDSPEAQFLAFSLPGSGLASPAMSSL